MQDHFRNVTMFANFTTTFRKLLKVTGRKILNLNTTMMKHKVFSFSGTLSLAFVLPHFQFPASIFTLRVSI